MKRLNKLFPIFIGLLSIVGTVAVIANVFDISLFQHLLGIGGSGFATAFAGIPSGRITEQSYHDNDDDLLERSVDDLVVMFKPDRFPLTTMMQNMNKSVPAKARKEEWVHVGYHARQAKTTSATEAGSGGDSVNIPVSDAGMWGEGDTVYIPDVTVGTPASEFRGYVEKVDTTNKQIQVIGINADDVPAVPDGTSLVRLSRAAASDDAQTKPHGEQGVEVYNYCQTFIGQITIEKILKSIGTYVDDNQVQNDLEMFDFRNSEENARLFGARSKVYDNEKKRWVYTMGGFEHYAGKSATYSKGSISNNDWIDLSKKAFKGNAGSEEKLLAGGSEFISSMLKVEDVQKQLGPESVEMVLGAKVNRITTTFGDFLVKWHKGFDENLRDHDAFSMDMNYIYDADLEPMEVTELDLDKSGQSRVDATRLLKTATTKFRYPDTQMVIKGT